jgi:apolipoprotein N-acyltransferase
LPIVRVANTGISAFISPFGEELVKIDLNQEEAKTIEIVSKLKSTHYAKFGNSIFFLLLLSLVIVNRKYMYNSRNVN